MKKVLNKEIKDFRSKLGIHNPGKFERKLIRDVAQIICIPPIQSLSGRLQLGLVAKIYDSEMASHSRLDHTIGVIAKCLVAADLINTNTLEPELRFSEKDVRELIVAAALHDCGHLPISHATERAYFTVKGLKKGITHEERILPLIVNRNPYFEELRRILLTWENFNDISYYRIASIICPAMTEEYEQNIPGYIRPKKAIQQLLVSDIDMDRLDYVIRDSQNMQYRAVTLIEDRIIRYVLGLSLVKYKSLQYTVGDIDIKDLYESKDSNVELCLDKVKIENVFCLLVSRVLLYKFIYFSSEVRSFEAVLTYLVGTLIENSIALQPLKLISMSDKEFLDNYLEELVSFLDDRKKLSAHLINKYVNVLRHEKVQRFKFLESIDPNEIKNPRLKEEFRRNINNRSYIDNLRIYLNYVSFKEEAKTGKKHEMEKSELLFDVFNLKTGGGDLLIRDKMLVNLEEDFSTLSKSMNGSNMHRLCSETRLDVYVKSDLSEGKKAFIKETLYKFFKTI